MKLQITLRENVPIEAKLIRYLSSIGKRTGEPKRILLQGFENSSAPAEQKGGIEPPAAKSKPDVLDDFIN